MLQLSQSPANPNGSPLVFQAQVVGLLTIGFASGLFPLVETVGYDETSPALFEGAPVGWLLRHGLGPGVYHAGADTRGPWPRRVSGPNASSPEPGRHLGESFRTTGICWVGAMLYLGSRSGSSSSPNRSATVCPSALSVYLPHMVLLPFSPYLQGNSIQYLVYLAPSLPDWCVNHPYDSRPAPGHRRQVKTISRGSPFWYRSLECSSRPGRVSLS